MVSGEFFNHEIFKRVYYLFYLYYSNLPFKKRSILSDQSLQYFVAWFWFGFGDRLLDYLLIFAWFGGMVPPCCENIYQLFLSIELPYFSQHLKKEIFEW